MTRILGLVKGLELDRLEDPALAGSEVVHLLLHAAEVFANFTEGWLWLGSVTFDIRLLQRNWREPDLDGLLVVAGSLNCVVQCGDGHLNLSNFDCWLIKLGDSHRSSC